MVIVVMVVVVYLNMVIDNESLELSFGEDVVGDVKATVLPHHRAVEVERLQQPVVRVPTHLIIESLPGNWPGAAQPLSPRTLGCRETA